MESHKLVISASMDEPYLLSCARYIELNPVRAGLVKHAADWQWSSASAHMKGKDDILVKAEPLLKIANKPWKEYVSFDVEESEIEEFRRFERTGRPLGGSPFIENLEIVLGRRLKPLKPGPKRKDK